MEKLSASNVLVVGAGGIGCELLKNLVMWHFKKITVVDLDTIDVSNLNRQFLFRKEHVGKSKALTAKESVLVFNPNVEIDARHDDIMGEKYNADFFKTFDVVLNALDNRTARNYVNRMCLKADVPLIESGTTGYRGQVQVILKGKTACYECYPKPAQKQYPACTIRNTPSEPIHCVVWAKFLFNQLFGEPDSDEDVVPDQNDPELAEAAANGAVTENGDTAPEPAAAKVGVRQAWQCGGRCDPTALLRVLFVDNINSLLSMKSLWMKERRVRPVVLEEECVQAPAEEAEEYVSLVTGGVREEEHLGLRAWSQVLKRSADILAGRVAANAGEALVWDKDDVVAMDFVAAAANIRMSLFHILPMKTRFDIKSMAGNIIPAIATTNAIVAGVMVLQAYKVLQGRSEECLDVLVSDLVSCRGKVVQAVAALPPVAGCYVCASRHQLVLSVRSLAEMTLGVLRREVLMGLMAVRAPNVGVLHSARVLIDGGEDEEDLDEGLMAKSLAEVGIVPGGLLACSDFVREYEFCVEVREEEQSMAEEAGRLWSLIGDVDGVRASARDEAADMEEVALVGGKRKAPEDDDGLDQVPPKVAKRDEETLETIEDDDDLVLIE